MYTNVFPFNGGSSVWVIKRRQAIKRMELVGYGWEQLMFLKKGMVSQYFGRFVDKTKKTFNFQNNNNI